jgi:diguanylate cyclase (GGDEF)-like protein
LDEPLIDRASAPEADPQPLSRGLYARVARVVSYLFIASALIVVTLAGAPERQPLLYVLLAVGAVLIVLAQDVLPMHRLGSALGPVEFGAVLVFLTILLALTGGWMSPFFVGYLLLVAGASLWAQGAAPYLLALAVFFAYLIGVLLAPEGLPAEAWGTVAFNIVALALISYVASAIAREQRRAHESALRLSRFDGLTQLHSRTFISQALDQEILRSARTGRPFGLLLFDLDGLKPVNDRFGHEAGDRLLRAVADVIRGGVRVTDVAGRYGGDEFVVLLPETDPSGALRVAEKLCRDIAQLSLPNNGQMIRSTVSIGLVTFPEDGRAASELMRRVDAAMYEAKRRGRDQIVPYRSMVARQPATGAAGHAADAQEADQPAPWERDGERLGGPPPGLGQTVAGPPTIAPRAPLVAISTQRVRYTPDGRPPLPPLGRGHAPDAGDEELRG